MLALLDHPERVDVVAAARSLRARQVVRAEVDAILQEHPGAWYAYGDRVSTVSVQLTGAEVELAALLYQRFGDAIEIDIGGQSFPLDPHAPRRALHRGVTATADLPGLLLTVQLDADQVVSGGQFRGLVWLHNTSAHDISLATASSLSGVVLDAYGAALAIYGGASIGTGRGIRLRPGERASIRFTAGMDCLDPALGTVLPAGQYDLIVPVPVGRGQPPPQLVCPPIRITVLPRPDTA